MTVIWRCTCYTQYTHRKQHLFSFLSYYSTGCWIILLYKERRKRRKKTQLEKKKYVFKSVVFFFLFIDDVMASYLPSSSDSKGLNSKFDWKCQDSYRDKIEICVEPKRRRRKRRIRMPQLQKANNICCSSDRLFSSPFSAFFTASSDDIVVFNNGLSWESACIHTQVVAFFFNSGFGVTAASCCLYQNLGNVTSFTGPPSCCFYLLLSPLPTVFLKKTRVTLQWWWDLEAIFNPDRVIGLPRTHGQRRRKEIFITTSQTHTL